VVKSKKIVFGGAIVSTPDMKLTVACHSIYSILSKKCNEIDQSRRRYKT